MRRLRLRGMRLGIAVCSAQLLCGLILAALFGAVYGSRTAAAAIFGALIAAVPGFFMALHVLPNYLAGNARYRAWMLVLGQVGKLFLTGGLFLAAALTFGRHFGPLLVTYVACLGCYWLALMITR